jgi:methylmalonyl-CoA mutase cobalamin-binding domain/chain
VGYRFFETFGKDKVLYPFGYGLSYTRFRTEVDSSDPLIYEATVTNTGLYAGRDTLMLFVEKPCGVLGNPARELVAFGKTQLLAPGESQTLSLSVTRQQLASFDDSGLTGYKDAYVMQKGSYHFYLGGDVRSAQSLSTYVTAEEIVDNVIETECRAVFISTFNGVALSFAKEVLSRLKENGLDDVTLVLGGALNENMDGSMLAVDVTEELASIGVNVENDLNKTVEIVRKIYEN